MKDIIWWIVIGWIILNLFGVFGDDLFSNVKIVDNHATTTITKINKSIY